MLRIFNSMKRILLIVMLMLPVTATTVNVSYSSASSATANSSSGSSVDNNAITTALCNIVKLLNGKAGKAIASIAIIFLALGIFVGKVSWGVAVATATGIAAMFGSQYIVNMLIGGSGTVC